jgi:hypothetical protein
MPLYNFPRRSFPPQVVEPMPINWRRGLLRVWLLVSVAWIMAWSIYLVMYVLERGFRPSDFLVMPILLLGPPIALLIFSMAARWAFRGFKVDERSEDD